MLTGRIEKQEGRFWSVELAAIGGFTQGTSRKDALAMTEDLVETMVKRPGFKATATEIGPDGENAFAVFVDANEPAMLAALVLRYQREAHGMSLADVAKAMGSSSRNGYARYEQGRAEPTLSKFRELLKAVAPELALIVRPRAVGTRASTSRVKGGKLDTQRAKHRIER